jgi:endoglucanase
MLDNDSMRVNNDQIALLERLCNACAVSGDEGEARSIVIEQVEPVADEMSMDAMGNVLAKRYGEGENRMRVMLAAHMDEVGLMLTSEDGDGVFRFEIVGGIAAQQLPAKEMSVGSDHIPGIVGAAPIHLTTVPERNKDITLDNMRIDVGTENAGNVKVGDRAVFATKFCKQGGSIIAKAIDDRIGVAILLKLFQNPPPNIDLFAAFTVQEEVGLRGARVAAFALDPDIAVALDCTPANDLPGWDEGEDQWTKNTRYNTRLGEGAAIYVADRRTLSDPRLVSHFVKTAGESDISFQFRQPGGGGTDAGAIHKQRSGIPSISISVPARYIHTAVSIARISDWENTQRLIYHSLKGISRDSLNWNR